MKKLSFIAILFAAAALSVHAQLAVSGWSSPQSDATQGRIRSAADDFIRPDSYVSAGINDWFAMTSFESENTVHLGYAKKLENSFLGVYYGGQFWNNFPSVSYTLSNGTWRGEADSTVKNYTLPTLANPSNRVAVLLGLGDMGFRLTFYSALAVFKAEDFAAGGTSYASYLREDGTVAPQLAWSMTKNLTEKGIKPYATLNLSFVRNYTKYETYGAAAPYDTYGSQTSMSQNYLAPQLNLGLGGFTLSEKDGFRLVADLDYVLYFRAYDNEYSAYDNSSTPGSYNTHKIKGLNNNGALTENTYSQNTFVPSLAGSWNGDKLRLRFKLNASMYIRNQTSKAMSVNPTSTDGSALYQNGADSTTSTFSFYPDFRLAAQWQIAPSLALNIGGRIVITEIQNETVEGKTFVNGAETANAKTKTVTPRFGTDGAEDTDNQLTLGVTFSPVSNVTFEASSGVSMTGSNDVSVFEPTGSTGLFYFYSLLLSLKF
jgi:hypothetical protein